MWIWIALAIVTLLMGRRLLLGYPRIENPGAVLSGREVTFLTSTAEVMFPAGGAIPISGIEADLPGYADRFLVSLQPKLRLQIRALFFLFEHVTLVFPGPGLGGFARFSSQSREARVAILDSWCESPLFIRQLIFAALRAVLTMGYLGHPDVMRFLRVAPYDFESPICEADLLYPPIGASPDEISYGSGDLTSPSDGTPIDLDGPLHPDFAEPKQ